ncbi:TPA: DUF1983 domain-containing protein, partial [Escherichia coli]
DNASKLEEFSKEWKDASDKWNAMWGVKIEQTKDGKHYVAGIGLSMEDTEEGKLSQFLVAANRIAFIDPSNGNTRPMFVGQGDQIFMNDVFLKRLTAPTITSGGNPPVFSLTPDGKLTAKNADISGSVNANAGTLNNVTINESCTIKGMLDANQVRGDFVKTTGHRFPHPGEYPQGSLTVHIKDDHAFDRQIIIQPIMYGAPPYFSKKDDANIYDTCRLIVRKNGNVIYDKSTSGSKRTTVVYSNIIDMPVGDGDVILTFEVQSSGSGEPRTWISDLMVSVTKKAASGISIS